VSIDWFEQLTGFPESSYQATRERLTVEGNTLISKTNEKHYGIGELTLPTVRELRSRVLTQSGSRTSVTNLVGDARSLHANPEFNGATIQVASQFNVLEMTSPDVSPEHGVTRYQYDPTQGPACAIAAGAATIFRNYFVDVNGNSGQTADLQLDTLAALGSTLAATLNQPVESLWTMRNGYALCTGPGLSAIARLLEESAEAQRDVLRAELAVGLHRDVQVTDVACRNQHVSQVFCSALPVAYGIRSRDWEPFARLVLEGCYEATLLCAAECATSGGSNVVLLTRVGGGAFGNNGAWIDDALLRALRIVEHRGLDVHLVSHGSVHPSFEQLVQTW
jgi:hypothetical protein